MTSVEQTRARTLRRLLLIAVAQGALLLGAMGMVGCGEDNLDPGCRLDASVACACADGRLGSQACGPSGLAYEPCDCAGGPQRVIKCDPGEMATCTCFDGSMGTQQCNDQGRFTTCVCEADAGP